MLQIDEMALRVPGIGEEEGKLLGSEVAQRLARQLPPTTGDRRIENLDVRLSLRPGLGTAEMADAIAAQILRQLNII